MESPHLALTLQNAWPRITHAICPKLNAAGQAPLMPKLPPTPAFLTPLPTTPAATRGPSQVPHCSGPSEVGAICVLDAFCPVLCLLLCDLSGEALLGAAAGPPWNPQTELWGRAEVEKRPPRRAPALPPTLSLGPASLVAGVTESWRPWVSTLL